MKFKKLLVGGTFDHFHLGHERFLERSISLAEEITLGITSSSFTNKKDPIFPIEAFSVRKKSVKSFFQNKKVKFKIIKINDFFGPSLSSVFNDAALFVSEENVTNGNLINNEREKQKLPPLKIVTFKEQIKAEDGIPISSFRIRRGEINRTGKVFLNKKWLDYDLKLPDFLRPQLKKPFGKIIKKIKIRKGTPFLFSVGDVTTKTLNEAGIKMNLSIVDFNVERKRIFSNILELGFKKEEKYETVANPAGTLKKELFQVIKKKIYGNAARIIKIDGEEDLAVLPLIISSPLNAIVFYGQPGEGIVEVKITERVKLKAVEILNKFDES